MVYWFGNVGRARTRNQRYGRAFAARLWFIRGKDMVKGTISVLSTITLPFGNVMVYFAFIRTQGRYLSY